MELVNNFTLPITAPPPPNAEGNNCLLTTPIPNGICGIYLITCIINGYQYAGQAIDCENRRYQYEKKDCKRQPRLYASLMKYGPENHTFKVIQKCSRAYLNHWEKYYIFIYDLYDTRYGMNMTDGGGVFEMSQESRDKKSASMKGNKNGLGKICPAEKKSAISEANTGNKYCLGRAWTDDQLKKMTEDNPRNVICQYDFSGRFIKTWISRKAVERELGFISANIGSCCLGIRKNANGFFWKYFKDSKEQDLSIEEVEYLNAPHEQENKKKVLQYDLTTGGFIQMWDSILSIEKVLGFYHANIGAACKGRYKTFYGYIWREYSDNYPLWLTDKELKDAVYRNNSKPIRQLSYPEREFIKEWESGEVLQKELGYAKGLISKVCNGKGKSAYGYAWEFAEKPTIEPIAKTEPSIIKKAVNKLDLNRVLIRQFSSIMEAAEESGISHSNISKCCRGKSVTASGFIWEFADIINKPTAKKIKIIGKPINQLDTSGVFIKRFDTINKVRESGFNRLGVSKCCHGKTKTAYGFIWEFAIDTSDKCDVLNTSLNEG